MSRLHVILRLLVVLSFITTSGFASGSSSTFRLDATTSGRTEGRKATSAPPPPAVSSFSVSPALAAPGQFVTFSWTSANANSFVVAPNIAQDEQTLPLSASAYLYNTNGLTRTTTFQSVSGAAGAASSSLAATLTIVPVRLTASATAVRGGQSVTLHYSGPNNNSTWELHASYSDVAIPLSRTCSGNTCSGSYETGPLAAASMFSVSLAGPAPTGGQAYSSRVLVSVQQPTTLSLNVKKQSAESGGGVLLSWTTDNAASVAISGVGQMQPLASGSYCCVYPSKSTTYTATAKPIYPGAPPVIATAKVTVSTGDISNLNHIIFLVQENRSFDNYLGQLAAYRVNHNPPIQGAQLSDVNDLHTLPSNYQLCGPGNLCYPLFHARTECTDNMSPNWDEAHLDMHIQGGDWLNVNQNSTFLMDNFVYSTAPRDEDPTRTRALGYYDQTDLPFYYELATQFTTDDAWYSPVATGTLPNRMYLFAGTSYGHAFNPTDPNDPVWQQPTIFRTLTDMGITWRYYYQDNSVFLAQWADWNDPRIQGNVRNIQEFYNYLASPNADTVLPQVIFIERATATELDEHPSNNIQTGSAVVSNMLGALFSSAAWPDSAFILTYDEGGGLFDHVGPILVTPPDDVTPTDLTQNDIPALFNTTGFRVPVVVVSPWSRPQTVIHLATDYTSILKLIEDRFHLPPLTQRDATTQDMADAQNGFFDFSSQHLLQVPPLPTQPMNGVCDVRFSGIKQVQIYH